VPRTQRRQRIEEALRTVELVEDGHRLVRECSGGMIRRLEIAEAVLHQPILLFLDEPTVGLDPIARETVWEHVEQLRTDRGTTILLTIHYTIHYMDEAEQLCDRVAVMHLDGSWPSVHRKS